jgi:hypothetical protein
MRASHSFVRLRVFVATCAVLAGLSARALAADRYALIVTGAAGGTEYAQQYDEWRTTFAAILRARFGYPDDHVIVLADPGLRQGFGAASVDESGVRKATREAVRAALGEISRRATKDDTVLVLLIGHGTADEDAGDNAKFNLVGPDLTAVEWADLVKPIAGRLIFVNTASGSAPFMQKLASRGRVIVTAADSTAQQYETVFPEFFIQAFTTESADTNKDGRTSIWEAFTYASAAVRQWYQERGRLQTERPMLDDNGDGVGREAQSPGPDGAIAQVTYLDADRPAVAPGNSADSELTALLARRAAVQSQIDQLKTRKSDMTPAQYDSEMEALLLELARLDRDIRARQPKP